MTISLTRRAMIAGALLVPVAPICSQTHAAADDAASRLAALERERGGRIGVAVLDIGTGLRISRRENERFAMCSTFKFLAAAAILARVGKGEERLQRRVVFSPLQVVTYSPVTKERVGGDGMTLAELCEAAITRSDNTAGNLLLEALGGPTGLTAYARSLGDGVTRLDRIETALNEATPGDPRDTTTPRAMLENLQKLVVGGTLTPASRETLTGWLVGNKTGDARLRAGLPRSWRVGDKTGAGDNGATNDIAVVWPPARAPIIISVYCAESAASAEARNAVFVDIGRIVAETV